MSAPPPCAAAPIASAPPPIARARAAPRFVTRATDPERASRPQRNGFGVAMGILLAISVVGNLFVYYKHPQDSPFSQLEDQGAVPGVGYDQPAYSPYDQQAYSPAVPPGTADL